MNPEKFIVYSTDFVNNDQPFRIMNPPRVMVPANKYELLTDEIDGFVSLNRNWDGYGAIPVIEKIGQFAKQLISLLDSSFIDRVSDVFPNTHGTLTIEWENRLQEKLSLEIGESNYSYFVKFNNTNPKFVNGKNIISDLKNVTSDLGELLRDEIQKYVLR